MLTVPSRFAEGASSGPHEVAAENDAVADGAATAERGYCVAVTLLSR